MPIAAPLIVFGLSLLVTSDAFGQEESGNPHDFLIDPVEVLLSRLTLWAAILTLIVVVGSLVSSRGRPVGRGAWGGLIAGCVVLPILTLSFAGPLAIQRAESNEFCASCHLTMQVYLDDMIDPNSESLAAIHYKNRYIPKHQCYDCHTSYGMFGTVEAKIKGMNDVYKYYTRTYELPIKMHHPYPNGDCLKCHAESQKWLSQEMHVENKDALFADEAKCLDCHGAMGHPAHILPEVEAAGAE